MLVVQGPRAPAEWFSISTQMQEGLAAGLLGMESPTGNTDALSDPSPTWKVR